MTETKTIQMSPARALERLEWGHIVNVSDPADLAQFAAFAVYRINLCYRGRWAHGLCVGHPDITGGTDDGKGNGVRLIPVYDLSDRQVSALALLPMQAPGGLARALYREYQTLRDTNHTPLADWVRSKARLAWEQAERYAETYNAIHGLT